MRATTWLASTALTIAALAFVAPRRAVAATIDVDSTTMLNLAPQTRGGVVDQPFDLAHTATAFEILSLTARDVSAAPVDDLTFAVKTWGAWDIADRRWDAGTPSNLTADLSSAYAQGRLLDRRLTLRVGRTEVAAGTARMLHLDGGEAVLVLPAGFRLSAFVGSPVSERFTTRTGVLSWNATGGDFAWGGRVGWSLALPGSAGRGLDLGASVTMVEDGGDPVRQEVGADLRLKLWDPLVVFGSGAYSVYDERLAEAVGRATFSVTRSVLVEADYRYVAPDLLLARNSILSVFSAEERQIFGGGVTWLATRAWKFGGYGHLQVQPGSNQGDKWVGYDANVLAEWRRGPTLAGLEGFALQSFENGYVGGRLYGRRDFGRAFASADVLAHFFRETVNAHSAAYTGTLTAGYELLRGLSAVASGQAGVTPYMEQTFELMAKLVYGATYRKSEVR
jgi:hypothetical protein